MSVADARISGPLPAREVAEGRAVEQDFVVELRGELGASPAGRHQVAPVEGTQRTRDDLALDVALQEALFVHVEQLVAVQAVRERGEAAAGNAGDDVDGVEQSDAVSLRPDDLRAPQELQHAVGERRGARAAAGEREDDQVFLVGTALQPRLDAVSLADVGLLDRRIDRPRGAAAQQDRGTQQKR